MSVANLEVRALHLASLVHHTASAVPSPETEGREEYTVLYILMAFTSIFDVRASELLLGFRLVRKVYTHAYMCIHMVHTCVCLLIVNVTVVGMTIHIY